MGIRITGLLCLLELGVVREETAQSTLYILHLGSTASFW